MPSSPSTTSPEPWSCVTACQEATLRSRSMRSLCPAPVVKGSALAQKGRLTLTDSTRKPVSSTAWVKSKLASAWNWPSQAFTTSS